MKKYSFHAMGLAIDINPTSNPRYAGRIPSTKAELYDKKWGTYDPLGDPKSISVKEYLLLKSYGFLWGRDFTYSPDLMHFVVGEVGEDGKMHLFQS